MRTGNNIRRPQKIETTKTRGRVVSELHIAQIGLGAFKDIKTQVHPQAIKNLQSMLNKNARL